MNDRLELNTNSQNETISRDTRAQLLYDAQKKSILISYILWFFFGWLGAHRFYLGKIKTGLLLLALSLITFLFGAITLGFGAFLALIPGIWVLVDAFLIPGMAREANQRLISQM